MEKRDRGLSRRKFLKAVGVGSASLALGGVKTRPVLGQDKRFLF